MPLPSLSAARSVDFSYGGQPYGRYTVRWQPKWSFLKHYALTTPLWWEHGTEVYLQTASYDQYGAGISIGPRITKKLSGEISYQFVKETSDRPGMNYTANIVSLSFSYQF